MVALKKLIIRCGYTDGFQPIVLRDRFVCGFVHESTRKRLLTENNDLTFERAVEIATMVEKASTQAKHMKLPDSRPSAGIHHLKGKQPSSQHQHKPTCYRCRGPHLAPSCRFIHEKCKSCGKTGHITKVCRSKGKQGTGSHQGSRGTGTSYSRTNKIDSTAYTTDSTNPSDTNAYTMFHISSRSSLITISLTLNGFPATMELDTGASYSVMGGSILRSIIGDSVTIENCSDISLRTYMGEVLPLVGKVTVSIAYKSQVVSLPLLIVKGEGAALFGRNWLEHNSGGLHNLLQKHQHYCSEMIWVHCKGWKL